MKNLPLFFLSWFSQLLSLCWCVPALLVSSSGALRPLGPARPDPAGPRWSEDRSGCVGLSQAPAPSPVSAVSATPHLPPSAGPTRGALCGFSSSCPLGRGPCLSAGPSVAVTFPPSASTGACVSLTDDACPTAYSPSLPACQKSAVSFLFLILNPCVVPASSSPP